jgi:hypothetical protein
MKLFVWTVAMLGATFFVILGGVIALATPVASSWDTAPVRFPHVQGSNLEKQDFNLPSDFQGQHNLLLVAFEREQQKDVDTWLKEMKRFEEVDPGFYYYELPTIERPNTLMRWFIDSGMRRGIPDRKARERTITLYLDKNQFCAALQIVEQKRIYEFLVDRSGNVLWRSEGVFDETKGVSLQRALGEHRP